jgi:hypothetical protein
MCVTYVLCLHNCMVIPPHYNTPTPFRCSNNLTIIRNKLFSGPYTSGWQKFPLCAKSGSFLEWPIIYFSLDYFLNFSNNCDYFRDRFDPITHPSCQLFLWEETRGPRENQPLSGEHWLTLFTWVGDHRIEPIYLGERHLLHQS